MSETSELIAKAEQELTYAKGEICSPVDNRLIEICELLLELIGRQVSIP